MTSNIILHFLDTLLDFTHLLLIVFIAFGWIFPDYRKAHLFVVLITGCSWIIFGFEYGANNCILTNWHYQILQKMGEINLPETYTQYALKRFTGFTVPTHSALLLTRSSWLISLVLSLSCFTPSFNAIVAKVGVVKR